MLGLRSLAESTTVQLRVTVCRPVNEILSAAGGGGAGAADAWDRPKHPASRLPSQPSMKVRRGSLSLIGYFSLVSGLVLSFLCSSGKCNRLRCRLAEQRKVPSTPRPGSVDTRNSVFAGPLPRQRQVAEHDVLPGSRPIRTPSFAPMAPQPGISLRLCTGQHDFPERREGRKGFPNTTSLISPYALVTGSCQSEPGFQVAPSWVYDRKQY